MRRFAAASRSCWRRVFAALVMRRASSASARRDHARGRAEARSCCFGDPRDDATEPGPLARDPVRRGGAHLRPALALQQHRRRRPIQTKDGEQLVVDNYVIWRIADPLAVHALLPDGRRGRRAADRPRRARRRARGDRPPHASPRCSTEQRAAIMDDDHGERAPRRSRRYGIEMRDVRINRTELPTGTEENVYARMRTERERLATKNRAEGDEQARAHPRRGRPRGARDRREGAPRRRDRSAATATPRRRASTPRPTRATPTSTRSCAASRPTARRSTSDTTLVLSPDTSSSASLQGGSDLRARPRRRRSGRGAAARPLRTRRTGAGTERGRGGASSAERTGEAALHRARRAVAERLDPTRNFQCGEPRWPAGPANSARSNPSEPRGPLRSRRERAGRPRTFRTRRR